MGRFYQGHQNSLQRQTSARHSRDWGFFSAERPGLPGAAGAEGHSMVSTALGTASANTHRTHCFLLRPHGMSFSAHSVLNPIIYTHLSFPAWMIHQALKTVSSSSQATQKPSYICFYSFEVFFLISVLAIKIYSETCTGLTGRLAVSFPIFFFSLVFFLRTCPCE